MDIKKQLEIKKKDLEIMVEQYNQTQRNLNNLGQQILKIQGAIDQLNELNKQDGEKNNKKES